MRTITIQIPIPDDFEKATSGHHKANIPAVRLPGEHRAAFKAIGHALAESGATVDGRQVNSPDRVVLWLAQQIAEALEFELV